MDPMDIDQVVAFEDADVDIGPVQAQFSLVGRLLSPNPMSQQLMNQVANGMWGTAENQIIVYEAETVSGVLLWLMIKCESALFIGHPGLSKTSFFASSHGGQSMRLCFVN
ncbi:unnamed protein product [Linum trigynum]|uniref:Uncharacterized protein n=1 Tax=Linum trigynum TaxID=586398 RepID=A0AAV2GN72_9ROSI